MEHGLSDERNTALAGRGRAMNPTVMVVEDEEAIALLLRYNLEAEGFVVEVITRGDDAELRLQEQVPDLLLLDWMLPGLSGIELCRRLRLRSETQRLPVIMLTARGEETERIRGIATGADDYVVKPFSRQGHPAPDQSRNSVRAAGCR